MISWLCTEPMVAGNHTMTQGKSFRQSCYSDERASAIARYHRVTLCTVSDRGVFRNAHGWRSDVGESSGREMAQGPYALGSESPRYKDAITFSLRKCRMNTRDSWTSALHSFPVWPRRTKRNEACRKAGLRERNKQETCTLFLRLLTGPAESNVATGKPLHPETL